MIIKIRLLGLRVCCEFSGSGLISGGMLVVGFLGCLLVSLTVALCVGLAGWCCYLVFMLGFG